MAEYVPVKLGGDSITLTSGAAITAGQLCYISAANTVQKTSAATASWIGVAAQDCAASGAYVTVFTEGVHSLTASGSITAGNPVEPAANGAVAAHTVGTNDAYVVGVALTTATNGNAVTVAFRS